MYWLADPNTEVVEYNTTFVKVNFVDILTRIPDIKLLQPLQ